MTGIYEPTYDDITIIQTDITNLNQIFIITISGLPYTYAGLNEFNILSDDFKILILLTDNKFNDISTNIILLNNDLESYKTFTDSNILTLGNEIISISTDYDLFKSYAYTTFYDISSTFINMASAIDEQFLITYQYIDEKDVEQKTYTDDEVTKLRNEGMIQEAVTQLLAWVTSDEGKRFRKKVWDKIKYKWLTFTGQRPYTELLDDVDNAITDELDD